MTSEKKIMLIRLDIFSHLHIPILISGEEKSVGKLQIFQLAATRLSAKVDTKIKLNDIYRNLSKFVKLRVQSNNSWPLFTKL